MFDGGRGFAIRGPSPAPTMTSTVPSLTSGGSSEGRSSRDSCLTEFDDLFGSSSDDDSEIVPLRCSDSVKKAMTRSEMNRESLPSLVIPSPTAWPTIQKLQESRATDTPPPPLPAKIPLSPAALANLGTATLRVPGINSTPSLDGSLPSNETPSESPSTPDLRIKSDSDEPWDMPVQLPPRALNLLEHISGDSPTNDLSTIFEVPENGAGEMQERGLNIDIVSSPPRPRDSLQQPEPMSAISVPSPGGFLASLESSSQHMWGLSRSDRPPSTATAERFYNVPWEPGGAVVERVIECDDERSNDGPPTARQKDFTANQRHDVDEMIIRKRDHEYDENYERTLHETASSNMSRTSLWLSAQETYLSALTNANPLNSGQGDLKNPHGSPTSPTTKTLSEALVVSPKKAVRFVEPGTKTPVTAIHLSVPEKSDPLFYHAFQHLRKTPRYRDAYTLRHLRADALQSQRSYLPHAHRAQLQGRFALVKPKRPAKELLHLPSAPNDPAIQRRREVIAQADRERQALQQISLSHWNLEADTYLSGGSLIPQPARSVLSTARKRGRTPCVLDFGGLPTADWGWAIASEHRSAKVYTAIPAPLCAPSAYSTPTWPSHRGPSNHRTLSIEHPWILPFPSNSFDFVSARTLYMLLRTRKPHPTPTPARPASSSSRNDPPDPSSADLRHRNSSHTPNLTLKDEYTATLAELRRILVPGGILHYVLLDAEVSAAPEPPPPPEPFDLEQFPGVPGQSRPSAQDEQLERHQRAVAASVAIAPLQSPTGLNKGGAAALHSRSVEFAVALRGKGYDPCAGRGIESRLADAGFNTEWGEARWIYLPVGKGRQKGVGTGEGQVDDGKGVEAVTELVGATAWERWMLKVQVECGKEESRLLEGVAVALDGARKVSVDSRGSGNAAWRMRVGWVRK